MAVGSALGTSAPEFSLARGSTHDSERMEALVLRSLETKVIVPIIALLGLALPRVPAKCLRE